MYKVLKYLEIRKHMSKITKEAKGEKNHKEN